MPRTLPGRPTPKPAPMLEASYVCPSCGEEIVVPVDPSEGETQDTIEDCPVCCCPNRLTIEIDGDDASVRAEST